MNQLFTSEKLKIEFPGCDPREIQILEKYWFCDVSFRYESSLKKIGKEFGLTETQLNVLSDRKAKVTWDFGICGCGRPIIATLRRRMDLNSCIKGTGPLNTYKAVEDFKKCADCNYRDELERFEQMDDTNNEPTTFQDILQTDTGDENIKRRIGSLNSLEITMLSEIYGLKNFEKVKNLIFTKYNRNTKLAWRRLFRFDELGLISADKNGSYINDISFHNYVDDSLNQLNYIKESGIEEVDIELTLRKIQDSRRVKFVALYEPDVDVNFQLGGKYEFLVSESDDKNLFLRIISIESISTRLADYSSGESSSDAPF